MWFNVELLASKCLTQDFLLSQWIIQAARKRKSFGGMAVGLSEELLQAFEGKGAAVSRRESVHKMAVANQVSFIYETPRVAKLCLVLLNDCRTISLSTRWLVGGCTF